ncbi:hypothetical protein M8J75_005058 [Diaphorina citri]|nr:hypothetical protein M8J75_005058 [Diaphorina citri]
MKNANEYERVSCALKAAFTLTNETQSILSSVHFVGESAIMSAPSKKAARLPAENESSGSEYDSDAEEEGYTGGEEIQVTFEGRSAIDSDFHGVKQLLKQLFLKAHINLSELTDVIISQSNIGSVVKQSTADEDMDDEDDESDVNDVFGITTVINITNKKHIECVQQLRSLLSELAEEHADDRIKAFVNKILTDDTQNVGLIINERFVNIPPQISVPLLQGLSKEIQQAKDKKMPYDFQHYILISKLYKSDGSKKKKNKVTGQTDPDILFSNAEEEVFDEEADLKFEFSVKDESDSALVGGWMEDDATMTPFRRVLVIPANKMDTIISKINSFVN